MQDEIYRRAVVPYDELEPRDIEGMQKGIEIGVVPDDRKAVFWEALKPGGMVPVMMSPEDIHIFVAGGAPGAAFSFNYYRIPPYSHSALMTKKITGATLTKAGA